MKAKEVIRILGFLNDISSDASIEVNLDGTDTRPIKAITSSTKEVTSSTMTNQGTKKTVRSGTVITLHVTEPER
ncbi:hypothetical protein C6495_10945 [Candidatus Poribacteria bacterium]|nr:MAG: hypothetical protein C6495_10945 [Candidatus Poribacteria bacterium]